MKVIHNSNCFFGENDQAIEDKLNDSVIVEIAKAHDKSNVQIILR